MPCSRQVTIQQNIKFLRTSGQFSRSLHSTAHPLDDLPWFLGPRCRCGTGTRDRTTPDERGRKVSERRLAWTLTPRGNRRYIRWAMRISFAMKALAAVAVGVILLGQLTPVAAGVLLCIGDGSDPDCCGDRFDSSDFRIEESTRLLDGSDCGCCITVDSTPPTAGAGSHKASIDVAPESALLRHVTFPTGARNPGSPDRDAGETRLASLRTVVLLI